MFQSILDSSTSALSPSSVFLCIAAALAYGIVIALIYMRASERYSKGYVVTLALLPVLVQAIILMTSGSLGTAVAVMGTFSLVRFRSAPGTANEIVSLLFAMAVGLACGMGQIAFGAVLTVIVAALYIVLMKTPFGERRAAEKHLKIRIPEDIDYTSVFDDVFDRYTVSARLRKVKTVNLGSMYDLEYDVVLKDGSEEKQMIDDLRVRNGNLQIVMARQPDDGML